MSNSIRSRKPITNLRIKDVALSFLAPADAAVAAERRGDPAEHRGYERGYQDGIAAAHAEVSETARQLETIIRSVGELQSSLAERMAEDSARLAVRIASKVIGRELTAEDTAAQVTNALKRTSDRQQLIIRLNAADLDHVVRVLHDERIGIDPDEFKFVADESVGRGGCIVDEQFGRADARIETQLREIENALVNGKRDSGDG